MKPDVERVQLPTQARSLRDEEQIPQTFELCRADPVDLQQVFDLLKRTVLLAVLDDLLGQHRPDPRKLLQLRRGGGVQVKRAFIADELRSGGGGGLNLQRDFDPLSIGQRLGEVEPAEIGLRPQPSSGGDCVLEDRPGRERVDVGPFNRPGHMDPQWLWRQQFDWPSSWLRTQQIVSAPQQQSNQDSSK